MKYTRVWQTALSKKYGVTESSRIISKARSFYHDYSSQLSNNLDSNSRGILQKRVLPGLSIYQALQGHEDSDEAILQEVEKLFKRAFFEWMIHGIRLINLLPDPFPLIRPALRKMIKSEYQPGSQEIIEDSPDSFAVNVYQCVIYDTLKAHKADELIPIFCSTDDWLTEAVPKIGWQRSQTLGRGGDHCDFHWSRLRAPKSK